MHLSMKSHHLLAGKDLALVCRDKDVLSADLFSYLTLLTAAFVLLEFQLCNFLAPFSGTLPLLL